MLKKTVYTVFLVLSLIVSNVSYGRTVCKTNLSGKTTCANDNGYEITVRKSGLSGLDISDNEGNRTRCPYYAIRRHCL